MPRKARLVVPNVPHHVTQRGSRRGLVFFRGEDRQLYLSLLSTYAKRYSTQVVAYCLMDNHVHHILVPDNEFSLAQTLKATHMRYATIVNGQQGWTGHLWQERFFSSPLDDEYFWTAVRYVERNPVKAGLVAHAKDYEWSSAKAHCSSYHDPLLTTEPHWRDKLCRISNWNDWLNAEDDEDKLKLLRDRTRRDQPCGSEVFIRELEEKLGRTLLPKRPGGRPMELARQAGTEGTVPSRMSLVVPSRT